MPFETTEASTVTSDSANEQEFAELLKTAPQSRPKSRRRRRHASIRTSHLKGRRLRRERYKTYLKSPHWIALRKIILERDDYRCKICQSTRLIEVHHLTYERLGHERSEDLVTLCAVCHKGVHRIEPHPA